MYNKFIQTINKGVASYGKLIIQRKNIIGRFFRYFQTYFFNFSAPTAESLFFLVSPNLARSLKMFPNSLTMLHIMARTISMDTALSA